MLQTTPLTNDHPSEIISLRSGSPLGLESHVSFIATGGLVGPQAGDDCSLQRIIPMLTFSQVASKAKRLRISYVPAKHAA